MNTDRVSIVKPSFEHFDSLVEINISAEVRQFLGGPIEKSEAIERATYITGDHQELCWSVLDKSGDFLGFIIVHEHHDSEKLEISYQFLTESWGKGYAFESMEVVLEYLFEKLGIDQVLAETQLKNLKSIKLLSRLGFSELKRLERCGESQILFAKQASNSDIQD